MFEIPEEVLSKVDSIIQKEHSEIPKGRGYCYMYWARKKELLKEEGYDWKTPEEENPNILYD